MAPPPPRPINLGRQWAAVRHYFPQATGRLRRNLLTCNVRLQPTPASLTYTVRVKLPFDQHPDVEVIDPELELHPGTTQLPHTYPGDRLCLYYRGEWDSGRLLARTILPWTSEWLLHYELWLATGIWHGGGITHETRS